MNPSIIQCDVLAPDCKKELSLFVKKCQAYDKCSLSLPEDSNIFFLMYENDELVSALSLYFTTSDCCECYAFTRHDKRQLGYFSLLLDDAFTWLDKYEDEQQTAVSFFFVTDNSHISKAVLDSIEAEFSYSEYMMELSLDNCTLCAPDSAHILISSDKCTAFINNSAVGECSLHFHESCCYLHHFIIKAELRRKGYGYAFLCSLITELKKRKIKILSLQVSSLNIPAVKLYKKTGFRITETLSYYSY